MTECPSRAAERYMAGEDGPEDCPVCGKANAHENGEPVFPEDWAFCSAACRDTYTAEVRAQTEAVVRSMYEEDRHIAEFNAGCALCKEQSKKLCRHQQGS